MPLNVITKLCNSFQYCKNWKELERLLTNQKAMVGQKERGDWAERVHLII
ncbi:hypothetical protein HMPREF0670_01535 [Prevotella sp. oral taxon 317 str. F0108]|nr:hypothetical protein HMPREF0670_01535 [Prevotella sp. oral taxon 317 str. F0108]